MRGIAALRVYFQRGLELFPDLHFDLLDVMWDLSSVVLGYKNQRGTTTAEFMEFDTVVRVVDNYGGSCAASSSPAPTCSSVERLSN